MFEKINTFKELESELKKIYPNINYNKEEENIESLILYYKNFKFKILRNKQKYFIYLMSNEKIEETLATYLSPVNIYNNIKVLKDNEGMIEYLNKKMEKDVHTN